MMAIKITRNSKGATLQLTGRDAQDWFCKMKKQLEEREEKEAMTKELSEDTPKDGEAPR